MNVEKLNNKIREYYYNEGYDGTFGNSAQFVEENGKLELKGEEYGKFMLFGRKAGKMPPIAPIERWCEQYGIKVSPWAIAYSIGKYGTSGNNFIQKNMNDFTQTVTEVMVDEINTQIQDKLKLK